MRVVWMWLAASRVPLCGTTQQSTLCGSLSSALMAGRRPQVTLFSTAASVSSELTDRPTRFSSLQKTDIHTIKENISYRSLHTETTNVSTALQHYYLLDNIDKS